MGGTKGWSACGGIERCPVSSQPSHCSPRGPRRLATAPASPTESPEQADSVSRLSVHCPSAVAGGGALARVWPVGVRSTRPNPQFGIPGIRPADPVFPSRGVPMATPALGRIAPPTMPSLGRRQLAHQGGQPHPCSPCHWHLGPVPPSLQMVATDPFFSLAFAAIGPLGHGQPLHPGARACWESESAMIKPPGSPALPPPPVALLRSLPPKTLLRPPHFFLLFLFALQEASIRTFTAPLRASVPFSRRTTSSPRPTSTFDIPHRDPGGNHRIPHSGRHSIIIPTISDIWRRRPPLATAPTLRSPPV